MIKSVAEAVRTDILYCLLIYSSDKSCLMKLDWCITA